MQTPGGLQEPLLPLPSSVMDRTQTRTQAVVIQQLKRKAEDANDSRSPSEAKHNLRLGVLLGRCAHANFADVSM